MEQDFKEGQKIVCVSSSRMTKLKHIKIGEIFVVTATAPWLNGNLLLNIRRENERTPLYISALVPSNNFQVI